MNTKASKSYSGGDRVKIREMVAADIEELAELYR